MGRGPFSVLIRAFFDSFRPRMLGLTVMALVLSIVLWLVLVWLAFYPLSQWATELMSGALGEALVGGDGGGELTHGFFSMLQNLLVPVLVLGILWPFVVSTAVLFSSFYAMPVVVRILGQTDFQHVVRLDHASFVRSLWFAVRSVLVFVGVWLITLPLWLIPGVAFLMPIVLTACLMISVMRFDVLSDYAAPQEMENIRKREGFSIWMIAGVCAFLSFIPPVLLIMPVMSSLAFARYYFQALEEERRHSRYERKADIVD